MTQITRKTTVLKPADQTERWFVVDAKDQILGRLSTKIAELLRDKDLPTFTPYVAGKTHVIVLNADKFKVTGSKLTDKRYYRHAGRPGSLSSRTLEEQLERQPLKPLEASVRGMLPPNKLRSPMLNRLHCYVGTDHPHEAQNPTEVTL
jgi:large subunit ribosomal protein L13